MVRGKDHDRNLRRQERTADHVKWHSDPLCVDQLGRITAEVATVQEPSHATGNSDGRPCPPCTDNRPGTARRAPLSRRTSTARERLAVCATT